MNENTFKSSYNALGTPSAPVTLTDDYTENTKTLSCKYQQNLQLEFVYVPKSGQTDRIAYVLVEISTNKGTSFSPISLALSDTDSMNVYTEGEDSTDGIPVAIPGDGTSTGGTTYKGVYNLSIIADEVKISAKESGSGNNGTLFVRATLSD